MRILGIETSTPVCSVALVEDDRILVRYTLNLGTHHSERLLPMIQQALADTGIVMGDLDGIAVASGPGSFTGLRIGMSTAKGLCLGGELPILPVSTLAGLALGAASSNMPTYAMLDARRDSVYIGGYSLTNGELNCDYSDSVGLLSELITKLPVPALFVGEGAMVYQSYLVEMLGNKAFFPHRSFHSPDAGSIALLGAMMKSRGAEGDVESAEPEYLRRSDAERVREDRLSQRSN